MDWSIQSAVPGASWPAIPAPHAATTLGILFQLEQSQWLPAARLLELQLQQLLSVVRHARAHVPFAREHWPAPAQPDGPLTLEHLAELPVLTRAELQAHYTELKSDWVAPEHGALAELRTSGSTGSPVRILRAALSRAFWNVFTLRDHLWHRRDLRGKLAAIRHGLEPQESPAWGNATAGIVGTGPAAVLGVDADIDRQIAWLGEQAPSYLLTYPSLVRQLAAACIARGVRFPGLAQVRTIGETLDPEVRALCRQAWGVGIADVYSAEEVGYIALQCPDHEHYHVQSEGVLVEVLDDHGRQCAPGEIGRIVVSDLHNFAMPLVRYDIGDYGELGEPCPCGRGLPVLRRIVGRVRNTLVTAEGRRYWPTFGQRGFQEIAPILRFQFVQTAYDRVEMRFMAAEPITAAQESRLRERIVARLPAGFSIGFVRVASLPRSASGKYEDFVSQVAAG